MGQVELRRVVKRYGQTEILRDISLQIGESELMVFVGPSGCGKSTLLRSIAGFESLTSGEIWMGGRRIDVLRPQERGVAMVFQNYALYPHMSVAENIGFGLRNLGRPEAEVRRRVREVAETLQIEALLERLPSEVSGGQRQRVAIGRAMIRDPRVFLLDEPLSNLDASLRTQMRIEIARVHQRYRAPMIFVTHDQVEALTLADRIAVMNQGRIEQVGTATELYRCPRNLFVAGFLGAPSMNFLPGELEEASRIEAKVRLPGGLLLSVPMDAMRLERGAKVTVGVRPEHVRWARDEGRGEGVPASVGVVEWLGNRTLIYLDPRPGLRLPQLVLESGPEALGGGRRVRPGDQLRLGFAPEGLLLFDSEGSALRSPGGLQPGPRAWSA